MRFASKPLFYWIVPSNVLFVRFFGFGVLLWPLISGVVKEFSGCFQGVSPYSLGKYPLWTLPSRRVRGASRVEDHPPVEQMLVSCRTGVTKVSEENYLATSSGK